MVAPANGEQHTKRIRITTLWFILLVLLVLSCFTTPSRARRFTILHTTDVHGWVFGHPHTPELDADFGDFVSLVEHMKANAAKAQEEFFLFDTGDVIEGTGMSDATQVHGQYIFPILEMVKNYNGLTMGNHDIGRNDVIEFMKKSFIPHWGTSYLTMNSLIQQTGRTIGAPYSFFRTELGTRVLVLGWMFNFTQPASMAQVQPVSDSILGDYFKDAMQIKDVDLIVVVAHIDPTVPPELGQIFTAIRKIHPTVPFLLFSGHRHITYFSWLDRNAFTLESGKYFEVVGHTSFDISGQNQQITGFNYKWVNTSRSNFYELAKTGAEGFLTRNGRLAKEFIYKTFEMLKLNETLGCSPRTYYPDVDYNNPESLFHFYINQVIPNVVFNSSFGSPSFFIINSGSLRYNLYKGRVNMNDIYTIAPFKDPHFYFNLTGTELKQVVAFLDKNGNLLGNERVPYKNTVDATQSFGNRHKRDITDAFYYSETLIETDRAYIVVMGQYDSTTLRAVLTQLFPAQKWAPTLYPTTVTSTTALQVFVERLLPCRPDCPC